MKKTSNLSDDSIESQDVWGSGESGITDVGPTVGHNSSLITIFTLWSTMMGTSILTMPWAINQSGFLLGILLLMAFGALMAYLGYRVLQSSKELAVATLHPSPHLLDFSKACSHYMGKFGSVMCSFSSILSLMGALVVYYVLICNFAFNIGSFINDMVSGKSTPHTLQNSSLGLDVACGGGSENQTQINTTENDIFNKIWSIDRSVPAWAIIIVFPLVSVRSPTFFTKFSALGTVAILYTLGLTFTKAGLWGIHIDFANPSSPHYGPLASANFPCITGVSSLAFFVHNALESIMRCNKNPENNTRDLFAAFSLVTLSYVTVGVVFLITFPGSIDCIADNLLNNLLASDVFAFVGRITLFFQIVTVYPLLMFILRSQVMILIFKKAYPGYIKVSIFHLCVIFVCLMFAMFLPSIGTIIRFSGSFSALIYIFMLPCLVYIMSLMQEPPTTTTLSPAVASVEADGEISEVVEYKKKPVLRFSHLTRRSWILVLVHVGIIAIGAGNFIAQIVITVTQ